MTSLVSPGEQRPDELHFAQEQYDLLMKAQRPWTTSPLTRWADFVEQNPEDAARIVSAITEWNRHVSSHRPVRLEGADLKGAYLTGVDLHEAKLNGADLSYARLNHGRLEKAELKDARLDRAHLDEANLAGADLTGASCRGTRCRKGTLTNAVLSAADLTGANFEGTDLSGATLDHTELDGTGLSNATATGASFAGALLHECDLGGIQFGPDHPAMHDGTDTLRLRTRDARLTWGRIRAIGALPLFGASYLVLGATLAMINSLDFINQHWGLTLTPPVRTMWLTLSSLSLVVGTTIYKVGCPQRVQTFSETEWVEQHGRARLQYLSESLKRRMQVSAVAFTLVGGVTGLALLAERLWVAISYMAFLYLGS